ncbi:hypothetical protein BWK51_00090 [Campylobacter fetus]|uniref:ATP-dependent DNA helicase n=1 Tax=Campylobacter fetus TaxID=196 RepID=UPI000FCB5BD8|nr:AAA family ATPase [Campylobacter fetus]RUT51685.1 hypothetical protein BWK51_00090 [Campylobacter fetus]
MLNEQQQIVYDKVLNGDERVILLQGEAGTGKSYTLSSIAKDYPGSVLITATTNKAKGLLQSNTGLQTYTTHSALGFNMIRNGIFEYLSDVREPKISDLLIIDEVSMLPSEVYQKAVESEFKKILLVGDEAQLPAIGLKASIKPDIIITLTKQMRQSSNEKLSNYLSRLREAITSKKILDITEELPEEIVIYDKHKDFCKAYLNSNNSKRLLTYSNKTVDSYNFNINTIRYKQGDLLVLDHPLGKLRNGDIVEILEVKHNDKLKCFELKVCSDEEIYNILVFETISAKEQYLIQVLNNYPDDYWSHKDKIFNPKHIYASTIHKAQGQSIDEVFIDVSDILAQTKRRPSKFNNYNKPISVQEYLRLLYVAISRMRLKAHLFIGDKRDYKQLKKG